MGIGKGERDVLRGADLNVCLFVCFNVRYRLNERKIAGNETEKEGIEECRIV